MRCDPCCCLLCSKDDFNGFLWNVVMLAMGGLALGQAVQSSGLLLSISSVSAAVVSSAHVSATSAITSFLYMQHTVQEQHSSDLV